MEFQGGIDPRRTLKGTLRDTSTKVFQEGVYCELGLGGGVGVGLGGAHQRELQRGLNTGLRSEVVVKLKSRSGLVQVTALI